MIDFYSEVLIDSKASPAMPLLQCPGPAPDFATHAVVNGNIGHVALKDYQGEKKDSHPGPWFCPVSDKNIFCYFNYPDLNLVRTQSQA